MKYRSRADISAAILNISLEGSRKTRIMYQCNLSFPQLQEYLQLLQNSRLIKYDSSLEQYRTTPKGFEFLKSYKVMNDMLVMEGAA